MRWEVNGRLTDVQACVERARDVIEEHDLQCKLTETSASRVYEFVDGAVGDVGRIKLSALPRDRTELYGYPPLPPTDRWLVDFLPRNIPPAVLGERVQALLNSYAWQIQQNIFDSTDELYHRGFIGEKIAPGFEREGLRTLDEFGEAREGLDEWRSKLHGRRKQEFEQILGAIESEIRFTDMSIRKFEGREIVSVPGIGGVKAWELIPERELGHEVVRLWCERLTAGQIADRVGLSEGRVYNILTHLRRKYPEAHLPYHGKKRRT